MYKKKLIICQLCIIIISLFTTNIEILIGSLEQENYKNLFTYILYVIDFGINFAIIIQNQFQGAILILYIIKTIFLIIQDQNLFYITFYLPIIAYYTYKAVCFIQIHLFKIQLTGNKFTKQNKEEQQKRQIKKRMINYLSLVLVLLWVICYLTTKSYDFVPVAIFIAFFISFTSQIYFIDKSQKILSKNLSKTMFYNLYLYILLTFSLSKMYMDSWFSYLSPLLILLTVFFYFSRIFIGCFSNKYHSADEFLFEITYIFKNIQNFSYLKSLNNQNTLRLIDNISRQIAFIIYILGFFNLIFTNNFFFFILGIYLINKYQYIKLPSFLFLQNVKIIKEKGYNFHFNLLYPLITSIVYFFSTQNQQKQIYFDMINQCSSFHSQFITFILLITIISLSIQLASQDYKQKLINFIQYSGPLLVFLSIYNLECLSVNLIIMELYIFGLCFESIRSRRLSQQKNEKEY